jgi:hypothetical protein
MPFLKATDFSDKPYEVPNQQESPEFVAFIEAEETKLLKKVLGLDLYNAFIDGLAEITQYTWTAGNATVIGREYIYGNDIWEALTVQTGTAPVVGANWELVEADNKWLSLKNGTEYTIANRTNEWVGMVTMLKPAIYSLWFPMMYRKVTASGVILTTGQQGTTLVNPDYEIVKNWNEFANYAGDCYETENTLYGFLMENESDYEPFYFTPPTHKNTFNL